MGGLKITQVERFTVQVPFQGKSALHMPRKLGDWAISEVCKVTTDAGLVGWGETLPFYTWGRVSDAAIQKVLSQNPFEFLWDDSLGAGLQMALWDLAGKALGVPCYRLLGTKVRDWCPIAWWVIDMPPDDWAEEAKAALQSGYTAMKLKARPWFDIFAQVDAISEVTPEHFALDVDFNAFLLNTANALPVLEELEDNERVAIFETPIPQSDVEGNKQLRRHLDKPIAHHFGQPPIMTALKEDVCDGFVLTGGAKRLMEQAAIAAAANKPFWLQLVGTGITTAWTLHLGAVLSHAQWSAITCLNIYGDDLLTQPLTIQGGYARVPEGAGLGVEVDEEALERYRVTLPLERPKERQIFAIVWDDGRVTYYASPRDYHADFYAGNQPVTHRGVRLEVIADDGSKEFADLYERVRQSPVRSKRGG